MKYKMIWSTFLGLLLACVSLASGAFPQADQYASPVVTWKQLITVRAPPKRAYGAMAYDPISKKIILFGGVGPGGQYLNDTWTFSGNTWTRLNTPAAPSPRSNMSMSYDYVVHKLILFGGYNSNLPQTMGDTWSFNGATGKWTQEHPAHSPAKAEGAALFTDPVNSHVDLFGGYDSTRDRYSNQTWQWANGDWHQISTGLAPAPRAWMATALDRSTKSVVLFGGLGYLDTNNTWTFDGTSWWSESPGHQPTNRYGAGCAYEPFLKDVVLFGGAVRKQFQSTWLWSDVDWQQLSPAKAPSAREGHAMAWDPVGGHVIVFGGYRVGPTFLNDTWTLISH